jgi:uncharacterized protein
VKRALTFLAFLLIAGFAPRVPAQVALPKFEALVTDLTGTLTAQQQASLDEKLTQFQARKGAQIAVLMLPSTAPEDIAQFGIRLADAWKVGRKGTDDGLILIVAKDDRAMRFEVGRGLEGAMPDVTAGRIISDTMAPLFRQGDFYGGINAGLDQAMRVIDGEALPPPDRRWQPQQDIGSRLARNSNWLIYVYVIFIVLMRAVPNRFARSSIAAGVAGSVAWWFSHFLPITAVAAIISAILVSVTTTDGGSRWSSGGGGWRGGGGFGGGSFGGGGGGFGGGGGGGFSGGGASGRW